jgi:nucleotide-binding universal stress UspA family protein
MAWPYRRILVPLDGSATAQRGLDEAMRLARLTGARMRLVHVVDLASVLAPAREGFLGPVDDLLAPARAAGVALLRMARANAEAHGLVVDAVELDTAGGRVADAVLHEVRRWPADVVVLGTHGRRGVRRLMLGSDAEQVLRRSPVPVMLVPDAAA